MENFRHLSRRKFLTLSGLAILGLFPTFRFTQEILGKNFNFRKGNIRIRPANPTLASTSFKKFCQHARFKTLEEAVRSVRNREPFIVYQTQKTESAKRIWGSYGRPDANALNPCENGSGAKNS